MLSLHYPIHFHQNGCRASASASRSPLYLAFGCRCRDTCCLTLCCYAITAVGLFG
jgi:hypothetical protein